MKFACLAVNVSIRSIVLASVMPVALQRAQLTLFDHPIYRHPAYWAPFLLLNNWL